MHLDYIGKWSLLRNLPFWNECQMVMTISQFLCVVSVEVRSTRTCVKAL